MLIPSKTSAEMGVCIYLTIVLCIWPVCIVRAVNPGCECVLFSSTFGQSYGQFTSPDFPKPYDPGIGNGCILYTFTGQRDEIVELTLTTVDIDAGSTCGDRDRLTLYLHLERGEVNEHTPSNGQICALPPNQRFVRYFSAFHTLILAFETGQSGNVSPTTSTSTTTTEHWPWRHRGNSSQHDSRKLVGFKGTYRFIHRSLIRLDGQRVAGSMCDFQFISSSQGLRRGKFFSPLYPSLYPSRSRCFYRFYGRYQERVKIIFEKLILGDEDVSCLSSRDGIRVYDGADTLSPVIAHLCDSSNYLEFWSSSSSLLVEFFSNSNQTYEGFEGKFYFLPAVSVFQSADSDDEEDEEDEDDEDDEDIDLKFTFKEFPTFTFPPTTTPMTTTTVTTTTTTATTKKPTPTTTIRTTTTTRRRPTTSLTTTTTKAPKTVKMIPPTQKPIRTEPPRFVTTTLKTTSTTRRAPITPTQSISTVTLVMNNASRTTEANLQSSEVSDIQSTIIFLDGSNSSSPCDQIFRSDSAKNGTFTSPNYSSSYPASVHCNYEFRGHGKERVQIVFTDFALHHPHDDPNEKAAYPWLRQSCDGADHVTAYISVSGRKEKIDDFCGSSIPRELMSNSATMSVSFHSTATSKGGRGFRARYAFVSNFGITSGEQISSMPCAFQYNSSVSSNGTFWSPNFPGYYPRDTECHYFFYGQVGERVKIVFSYFDIEGMQPCVLTSASDYVEVSNFMTVDRKLPRYCGQLKDLKMESDGSFFRVTFKSNDRFDGTGFYASYQFRPVADAVTITRRRSSSRAEQSSPPSFTVILTVTCFSWYLAKASRVFNF